MAEELQKTMRVMADCRIQYALLSDARNWDRNEQTSHNFEKVVVFFWSLDAR
jgi:hypothetical protein